MRIVHAALQRYRLPLARPLTTGGTADREGFVLTIQTDTGLEGYGEIAPLPGLHKESLSQAFDQILTYRSCLLHRVLAGEMLQFGGRFLPGLPETLFPSVRFGMEMAILDVLLQSGSVLPDRPGRVPVNALLAPEQKGVLASVEQLLGQGFKCIKMKVARQPLDKDIQEVTAVLSAIRHRAALRLDANRRWTLPQAVRFCDAVDVSGIEYIEEPTEDWTCHAQLAKQCAVPIALDETLAEIACEQLDPRFYRAVVLKPGVLGGFDKTDHLIRWARRHQITPVISSAFESALTTRMVVAFAQLEGITQTPLGLDTGKWFQADLLCNPVVIQNGCAVLEPASRPVFNQPLLQRVEAL